MSAQPELFDRGTSRRARTEVLEALAVSAHDQGCYFVARILMEAADDNRRLEGSSRAAGIRAGSTPGARADVRQGVDSSHVTAQRQKSSGAVELKDRAGE